MVLTPGLRFLTRQLVFPATLVIFVHRASTRSGLLRIPLATAIVGTFFARIGLFILRNVVANIQHRREARRLGARPLPYLSGKKFGNFDFIERILHEAEHGYLGDELRAVQAKLGQIVNIWPLWENHIFTTEPAHIQAILATDFNNNIKGERFKNGMESVLGTGVFNSDGDLWSFHRSMSRPYFSRDRVRHFEIFDRHATQAISLIKQRMREGLAVDFQELISRFTMDSATEFLFGESVDSLEASLAYPHNLPSSFVIPNNTQDSPRAQAAIRFTTAFGQALTHLAFRERTGWIWPLYEIFEDATAKPMAIVAGYLDPIIQRAVDRGRNENEPNMEDDEMTLLDDLVKSTSDAKILKDEILNILLAGRDTTMSGLTSTIYFLARHPNVLSRLRGEILDCIGPTNAPTYDDIKKMKYLRAVLNETMRIYPPVPFNVRETVNATVWPSPDPAQRPIYIPGRTPISYSVMLMHRRKDLWGEDAEEFDPDRFIDERLQKYLVSNPFQFLPFNAGPRICLGQQFAYNEMSFVLVRLLQHFSSIKLDPEAAPPAARVPESWKGQPGRKGIELFIPESNLTLYAKGGMWVKMGQV
ncbi:hypothetical protein MIND_01260400 [Mycena indigotica]|uniref:Cytochrome P450 n=1 Tax=Mycena indigotica TaxID=2126181 RepID=A0A8H6S1U6_9AGAR|nr:uncharacterized protein MIND_01260400 [Mycena indigotica]KAF7291171.1 hypothetical protein MIND_01260400 [Mycena indigotica]